jgi:hypothetical protein
MHKSQAIGALSAACPTDRARGDVLLRHSLLVLFVLLLGALLLMPRALAQGTLDQSNTHATIGASRVDSGQTAVYGQTFTAGATGLLDSAAFDVFAGAAGTQITVSFYATTGSLPNALPFGAPLATATLTVQATIAPVGTAQWSTVSFSPAASVVAGQVYALTLGPITSQVFVAWFGGNPGTYVPGAFISSPTGIAGTFAANAAVDFDFETFVTPLSSQSFSNSGFSPVRSGSPPYSGNGADPRCFFGCGPNGLP